jgi:hypothetical protein
MRPKAAVAAAHDGRFRCSAGPAIRAGVVAAAALALTAAGLPAPVPARAAATPAGLLPAPALVATPAASAAAAAGISGDYLEARTADVFTGPCFANSEMSLVGKQAVLAWRVRQGAWEGVPLAGLSVVAAVRAAATLGDPYGGPLDPRALVVVDQRATAVQREALVALARALGGELLSSVVGVESAPIELALAPPADGLAGMNAGQPQAQHQHHLAAGLAVPGISGEAHLRAGDWIALDTRAIGSQDHLCGNEEVFYPPLTAGRSRVAAVPAVTVAYDFRGPGLGMVWSSPGKRSAFVGSFAR